jgi:hypothetical protein
MRYQSPRQLLNCRHSSGDALACLLIRINLMRRTGRYPSFPWDFPPMTQRRNVWSVLEIETMREMLAAGVTRGAVASQLGRSKGSVRGLAYRLRIDSPPPSARSPIKDGLTLVGAGADRGGSRTRIRAVKAAQEKAGRAQASPAMAAPPLVEPSFTGVSLFELGDDRCHWPVDGEGSGALFCGADRNDSWHPSYCRHHAALAFRAAC